MEILAKPTFQATHYSPGNMHSLAKINSATLLRINISIVNTPLWGGEEITQ